MKDLLARIIHSYGQENSIQGVDRGVTLEGRRHQRGCFILCPTLGTMFDLCTANLASNLPRWRLQGTTALPSFRKGYIAIACLPRIFGASGKFPPHWTAR